MSPQYFAELRIVANGFLYTAGFGPQDPATGAIAESVADQTRQVLVAEQLRFNARQRRHLDWTGILWVVQSGSKTGSLIFSALMAKS